jgi:hypothetical protein
MVLDAAPLPALPRAPAAEAIEPPRTKKAVLLALYRAHTSHLLAAKDQFLTEMITVEIDAPEITRPRDHDLYDVSLLRFR